MNDLINSYEEWEKPLVLASTGIAAVNIWWWTVHSFFSLWIKTYGKSSAIPWLKPEKVITLATVPFIVIDEISMIHSNTLDVIDQQMRISFAMHFNDDKFMHMPFAWKTILLVWDVFQLPPVTNDDWHDEFDREYESEFFFSADVIADPKNSDHIYYTELDVNYRQWTDKKFWDILDWIRDWTNSFDDIKKINERFVLSRQNNDMETITLTTTNKTASRINNLRLTKIEWFTHIFPWKTTWVFPKNMIPHFWDLKLKIWARIIMLNNDSEWRRVNWSLWYIEDIVYDWVDANWDTPEHGTDVVKVKLDWSDTIYTVPLYRWKNTEKVTKTITRDDGTIKKVTFDEDKWGYIQYPMKLARAITIHKSQWQTFDKCKIDLERWAFATWQLYVALSRCRTLEWITLLKRARALDIKVNPDAIDFHLQMEKKSLI